MPAKRSALKLSVATPSRMEDGVLMETKWAPEEGHAAGELADVSVAQFSGLMARIYQGPLENPPWAGALELIRTSLNANYATLILRSPSSDRRGLMVHASELGP